jgi:putative protease
VVILDFEFGRDYRPSIDLLRKNGLLIGLATNRILKPLEYHHLKSLISMSPDSLLIRNLGALQYINDYFDEHQNEKKPNLIGDFSLNISNIISANYLLQKGIQSFVPSLDLNRWQLEKLLKQIDLSKVEIPIHHHLAEFHMEHCVFAAFLSQGSSFKDCGKPCETHKVELIDPYKQRHLLQADQECRNTMFRSKPQTAARMVEEWIPMGLNKFRLEFTDEKGQDLIQLITQYMQLVSKKQSAQKLIDILKVNETFGVTEGQLSIVDTYQNRKQQR